MTQKNKLPKDWKYKTLGEILKISSGSGLTKSKRNDEGEFLVYGGNGITGKHSEYLFEEERFIIGRVGVHCGNAYITKPKSWVTDNAFVVSFNEVEINKKFLLHLIGVLNLNKYSVSTAQPVISQGTIYPIEITLPPLDTQHLIVSKIEELFSELDKGIEDLKTSQLQLKTYRQSVLKYAFEGKLTNKKVKEAELPKSWDWVKIEFLLFDTKKGMSTGPFGTMLKKYEHQKDGIPVLGIENIGEGVFQLPNKIFITSEKAKELKNFVVIENDIIISRSGTVGEICLLPKKMENSIISTNLIRVRLNQKIINPKYFVYLFQGGKVRQEVFDLCKGSSRAFLNQTILKSLNFPYCEINEQNRVIQEIESRLSVADKMEESITQSLQQSEILRQSILKKAFSGELV